MNQSFLFTSIVITLLIIFLFFYINWRNRRKNDSSKELDELNKDFSKYRSSLLTTIQSEAQSQIVPVIHLPTNFVVKESSLHEIANLNLLEKLSSLSPAIVNAIGKTKTVTTTTTSKVEGNFYKVILEKGGELVNVKDNKKLFRGYALGKKGISEQAKLQKIDPKFITKTTESTAMTVTATANIMNIASLIVGQYYMSEVNAELEKIEKSISDIRDFQKLGFKSRIRSLIANVGDMSIFIEEIFEDDTIRNNKLIHLQYLKEQTTQLLEQVNLTIEELINKSTEGNFKKYIENVNEFESLLSFQEILLKIMQEIGRLEYIFGKGKISRENSFSLFNKYKELSVLVNNELASWQNNQIIEQKISLEEFKFRKQGIGGTVTSVTGLIKDEWRYSKLDEILVGKVTKQLSLVNTEKINVEEVNLYEEDTQLLIRNGKTYLWLPEKN
ncbi:hypothetical protein LZ578_05800 [Jeotgalibaca sp. MA1X17-3]|uniref:hypothetical protein n=1 Tax=Jeotgalibaca sp. MA1X17-3 TaxID=2908211 RepID=UPI001F2B8288|nr:hypothetical protein [Jeotgalibaca sp. MA1X17-3]UJF16601.1 hypothetical protein LZ578_05800 [Jeotgalibaca sp. MA1X17-3]